jgi:hypothetical protein
LLAGIEAEVLAEAEVPGREAFLREFAEAYLDRSKCLRGLRRTEKALRDLKRAAQLDDDAEKLAAKAKKPVAKGADTTAAEPAKGKGTVWLINAWSEPVTVVIDGTAYPLEIAEIRVLSRPAGPIQFEVQGSQRKQKVILEAGKSVKIWIGLS